LQDQAYGARQAEFDGEHTKEKGVQGDAHIVEGLPGKGHIAIHIEGKTPQALLQ
jgi:hypothetical protein